MPAPTWGKCYPMADWADALYQVTMIGMSALFVIVVLKLIIARFPVPGLKEAVALV